MDEALSEAAAGALEAAADAAADEPVDKMADYEAAIKAQQEKMDAARYEIRRLQDERKELVRSVENELREDVRAKAIADDCDISYDVVLTVLAHAKLGGCYK